MIEYINTQSYPVWKIDLSKMKHYAEILKLMRERKIVDYVYTFIHDGVIVKHGLSAPMAKKPMHGERIYRQAGHLRGWSSNLKCKSGEDMEQVSDLFYSKTGKHLNRRKMCIIVRDLTNEKSTSIYDCKWHVKELESKLIADYLNQFGETPIGNIRDESYVAKRDVINPTVWDELFDEAA